MTDLEVIVEEEDDDVTSVDYNTTDQNGCVTGDDDQIVNSHDNSTCNDKVTCHHFNDMTGNEDNVTCDHFNDMTVNEDNVTGDHFNDMTGNEDNVTCDHFNDMTGNEDNVTSVNGSITCNYDNVPNHNNDDNIAGDDDHVTGDNDDNVTGNSENITRDNDYEIIVDNGNNITGDPDDKITVDSEDNISGDGDYVTSDNFTGNNENITGNNDYNVCGDKYKVTCDDDNVTTNNDSATAIDENIFGSDDNFSGDNNDDILRFEVEHNIIIKCSQKYIKHYGTVSKMSATDKNTKMSAAKFPRGYRFATDIFNITILTSNDIINDSSLKENSSVRKYSLLKDADKKIEIKVPIQIERTNSFLEYSAWIEQNKIWKIIPANYEAGFAIFSCSSCNSFAVICCPEHRSLVVTPTGYKLDIEGSSITLIFEKDTVKSRLKFKYLIEKPMIDSFDDENESYQSLAVSEKISFEYDKSKFLKPLTVVHKSPDGRAGSTPSTSTSIVKFIGYHKDNPVIVSPSLKRNQDDKYVGKLQGYDGVTFVSMKKKDQKNLKLTEILDVIYGRKALCSLLLFYQRKVNMTLFFHVECCLAKNKAKLRRKNTEEGSKLIFQSEDLFLLPHQRIKIRPACSIGVKPGQTAQFTFVFLSTSDDNNISIEVEIKRHIGGTPNAILEFSTDNKRNLEIAKAEFRIDKLVSHRKDRKGPTSHNKADNVDDKSNVQGTHMQEILNYNDDRTADYLVVEDNVCIGDTDDASYTDDQSIDDRESLELMDHSHPTRNTSHLNERYEQ